MTHTFTVALYGVVVTICRTKVGWSGYAPENPATGLAGACMGLSPGHYLIGWFDGRLSTLVHECVHAALFILRHVGMNPADSQGEAMAYLTEYLFQQARTTGARHGMV